MIDLQQFYPRNLYLCLSGYVVWFCCLQYRIKSRRKPKLSVAKWPFYITPSQSMDTLTLTFLCSQKKFLSEFWIFTWQPTGNDDYWHLTCSVLEHWSQVRGPNLLTCTGLAQCICKDYSFVLPWSWLTSKGLALAFPWIVENTEKTEATCVFKDTHMRLTQIIRDFESPSNWISNRNKKLEQTKSCCSKILHLLRSLNVHTATGLTCEKTMKAAEGSREGHQAITQQRNHQATCYFTAK